MRSRWRTNKHCVFNLGYHLIWCPKYRKSVLRDGVDVRLKELIAQKASELGITIESMEVMPDHIHLFVKSEPIHSPHYIVQQLKGFSSHELRNEFPWLRSILPTLWSRSYFCESVGHISESTVTAYIEAQKKV